MESLPSDVLRLLFSKYLGVEIPKMFCTCKRFNNLFTKEQKEKIHTIVATYQRKVKRRRHNYKRYLTVQKMFQHPLLWNDVELGLAPFVFGVNVPTGFTSRYVFGVTYDNIFCDKCDAIINGNHSYFEKHHMEVCKGNLDIIKPLFFRPKRCCVKQCPYRTKICWELSKHEYECKRKLWTCKLCSTENISTDKRRAHLSLGCQPIKDRLKDRFNDKHSVLWRKWMSHDTIPGRHYISFAERRKKFRRQIKRDLMKEFFRCETFLENI